MQSKVLDSEAQKRSGYNETKVSVMISYGGTTKSLSLFDNLNNSCILSSNPNPFYHNVKICFNLSNIKRANISVFNIQGGLVKNMFNAVNNNKGSVLWDGRDGYGVKVPSGMYFITLKSENFALTRPILKTE